MKFTQAVRGLMKDGVGVFVEIGPGQVLSGLLRRCDRSLRTISVGDAGRRSTSSRRRCRRRRCRQISPRSRGRSRSSPGVRGESAPPSRGSSPRAGARVAVNYRTDQDAAERSRPRSAALAVQAQTSPIPSEAQALVERVESELGRPRHPRQQRRRDPRHAHRPHERRGLGRSSSTRTCAGPSTRAAPSRARCSGAARA